MMRSLLLLTAAFVSCTAPRPSIQPAVPQPGAAHQPPIKGNAASPDPKSIPSPVVPSGPIKPPSLVRASLSGIAIEAVSFDSRSHYLAVADQPDGPGSKWPDCRAAGKAGSGIAAINAGFFTPEGGPLGRVIANGVSTGGINRGSSLGSGFYVCSSSGNMELIRRERFKGGHQALQSGPFLIENGRAIGGLSGKQSSARSFVACDGGCRWIIARTGACSLSALANALEGQSIGSTRLSQVLNLDGGRSSEIWASDKVTSGPRFERPFWNKPVRNFLIVSPRP